MHTRTLSTGQQETESVLCDHRAGDGVGPPREVANHRSLRLRLTPRWLLDPKGEPRVPSVWMNSPSGGLVALEPTGYARVAGKTNFSDSSPTAIRSCWRQRLHQRNRQRPGCSFDGSWRS